MATASLLTYPHIRTDSAVMGGRPCIAGTRVRVMDIVTAHRGGLSPEQLTMYFSSRTLTLSEIHAALTYYYDHQEPIDAAIAEDDAAGGRAEAERIADTP